jgi:CheY-like chemotaxis protein
MESQDLDEARELHAALLEVFAAQRGGREQPEALARVRRLCELAMAAVGDLECWMCLRSVGAGAALLYSDDGHLGVEAGSMAGVDFLRLQIVNELSAFRGRINAIAADRLREDGLAPGRRPRQEPRALTTERFSAGRAQRRRKVLIVEDNADAAESLRRLLDLSGYEVLLAFTGEDGLRAARRFAPDVVLCDLGLPDTDGLLVANALRNDPETAGTRLIAVTAYGASHDRRRARGAGFDLHLVKPVDPDELLDRLATG